MDKECYLGKHRYGAESDLHTDSIETPSFITYIQQFAKMELPHDPTDFNKKNKGGLRIQAVRRDNPVNRILGRMVLKGNLF